MPDDLIRVLAVVIPCIVGAIWMSYWMGRPPPWKIGRNPDYEDEEDD